MQDCLLTIAICTFNRATLLIDALKSLRGLPAEPNAAFEILVIDNNSSDQTRRLVEEFAAGSAFRVRYLFEKSQGLSRARNLAVAEAKGEWIWYVDDDVYFSPNWISEALHGIRSFPDASVLAGRVEPLFEASKPSWLVDSLLPYYGLTSFGNEPRWLEKTEYPVGANVGFRTSVFKQLGLFKLSLGRLGNVLLSCEETELVTRIYDAGHRVAYVPGAEVRHRVVPQRAKLSWLRKRAYWGGISFVMTEGSPEGSIGFGLIREAARTLRRVGRLLYRQGFDAENQIKCAWQIGTARQCVVEAARSITTSQGVEQGAVVPDVNM